MNKKVPAVSGCARDQSNIQHEQKSSPIQPTKNNHKDIKTFALGIAANARNPRCAYFSSPLSINIA